MDKYTIQACALRSSIVADIKGLLNGASRHDFKEPFIIHWIDGDVATTETAVAIGMSGMNLLIYSSSEVGYETTDDPFGYDIESLILILENLKSDLKSHE